MNNYLKNTNIGKIVNVHLIWNIELACYGFNHDGVSISYVMCAYMHFVVCMYFSSAVTRYSSSSTLWMFTMAEAPFKLMLRFFFFFYAPLPNWKLQLFGTLLKADLGFPKCLFTFNLELLFG